MLELLAIGALIGASLEDLVSGKIHDIWHVPVLAAGLLINGWTGLIFGSVLGILGVSIASHSTWGQADTIMFASGGALLAADSLWFLLALVPILIAWTIGVSIKNDDLVVPAGPAIASTVILVLIAF